MPRCYPISNRLYVTTSAIFPTVCESIQIVESISFDYNKYPMARLVHIRSDNLNFVITFHPSRLFCLILWSRDIYP